MGVVRLFGKGSFLTSLATPLEKSVQTSESKNISSCHKIDINPTSLQGVAKKDRMAAAM